MKKLAAFYFLLLLTGCSYGQVKEIIPSKTVSTGNILLNGIKFDTLSLNEMHKFFDAFSDVSFKKANLFFSGAGFPYVVAMSFEGKLTPGAPLDKYFQRLVPGSRITFEKSVLVRNDGILIAPFNKSIFLK